MVRSGAITLVALGCLVAVAAIARTYATDAARPITQAEVIAAVGAIEDARDDLVRLCHDSGSPVICQNARESLAEPAGLSAIELTAAITQLTDGDVIATLRGRDAAGGLHEGRVEFARDGAGHVRPLNPIFWGDYQLIAPDSPTAATSRPRADRGVGTI